MSALYHVHVAGDDKGEVFKVSGRWRWLRGRFGAEVYSRRAKLLTVREHVARVCRVPLADVRLVRTAWSPPDAERERA